MLVGEEEGGTKTRKRHSCRRVLLRGGLTGLGQLLRGRVHPRERENVDRTAQITHLEARSAAPRRPIHRDRGQPHHICRPGQLVCSRFERARSVQLFITRPKSSVQRVSRVNRRTNARESTFHPSTAHHTVPEAYVYVGWDGTFCVWSEGERVAVPLVYQSHTGNGGKSTGKRQHLQ